MSKNIFSAKEIGTSRCSEQKVIAQEVGRSAYCHSVSRAVTSILTAHIINIMKNAA